MQPFFPQAKWAAVPEDMQPVGEPGPVFEFMAVLRPPMQRYQRRVVLTTPGARLAIAESALFLVGALPEYVRLGDAPGFGERTVVLEHGLLIRAGEFYSTHGQLPNNALRGAADPEWLVAQIVRRPAKLSDEAAWAEVAKMTAEELDEFTASPEARSAVEALAARRVRQALEQLSAVGLAEQLLALAEAGTVPGWSLRMLAGGVAAFLELLGREIAKRPAAGILDLVQETT